MRTRSFRLLAAAASLGLAGAASLLITDAATAATIWDESVDGDLSTDPGAPTAVAFAPGSNTINGTVVAPADAHDYITFTIAPGQALAGLLLNVFAPGNTSFHAINAGATSFNAILVPTSSFLGVSHVTPVPAGTDLLPGLASGQFGSSGFTVPLGPGTYSYVFQQTGPEFTTYSLEFVVTPEPSALALLAGAMAVLLVRRRA